MNDDAALLHRYAEEGSQAAFTELVRRHVDLVYGAALRRSGGNSHRAADVAQQVFTTLARDARKLSRHTVLNAWLHTATRNAALNLMISEQRRQARELVASSLTPTDTTIDQPLDWEQLRPLIDGAIDELPEADRAAVVLRFLEQQSFARIGATLQISADAARMRTERALEKLRAALARRGVTSTAAAIGALVSSQPLVSAPASLAATFSTEALAVAGASFTAATFVTFMSMKTLATIAIPALVAFGAGTYFGLSRDLDAPPPPPLETPRHSQLIASLRQENRSLRSEVDRLTAQEAARRTTPPPVTKAAPTAAPSSGPADQLARSSRHKAISNNLRQLAAAIDQFQLDNGRPPTSLEEIVGDTKYIRRLIPVDGENYATNALVSRGVLTVIDSEGLAITYDPNAPTPPPVPRTAEQIRIEELGRRLQTAATKAVEAYRAANGGQNPPTPDAVIPYFATAQEGADFVEVLEAQRAAGRR